MNGIIRRLLVLLLLAAPAAVQAQFQYTVNNGAITITNYVGTAGNLVIPPELYVNGAGFVPVTAIGSGAFFENDTLTGVTIPGSVTAIGSDAFYFCTYLTNATLANGLASIGDHAFAVTAQSSIMIPASVTSIGDYAFSDSLLNNVIIPGSVTNLGEMVFYDCPLLTNAAFANGFANIGQGVLYGCAALAGVTIAGSVTNIGDHAFGSCPNLRGVYFAGNTPIVDQTSFEGSPNVTIYYLSDTSGWADFGYFNTGLTAVLWNPLIQTSDGSFGVQNKHFGFNISNGGSSNIPIMVEACTNLAGPVWTPLQALTLTNSFYFTDPQWTNYRWRFYRISSP